MFKRILKTLSIFTLCLSTAFADPSFKLDMTYGFYTQKSSTTLQRTVGLFDPTVVFPIIPGSIFGWPSPIVLAVSETDKNKKLSITLPKNVDSLAKPFIGEPLTITPSDSKILRLGTFHLHPEAMETLASGGFVNTKTNNILILVYTSSAIEIKGTLDFGQEQASHDLEFDSAGWHWIETQQDSNGVYSLNNYTGDFKDIEFAVIISPNIAI